MRVRRRHLAGRGGDGSDRSLRAPRNGRTFEGEGEDPLLAGTIVGAQLRGTQSEHVPATIKHFAENDEERHRYGQSSDVSERAMREIELRAFQIGIEQSNVTAVMCAYNRINGTPACEWSTRRGTWAIAPGRYPVWVGASSRDLPLEGSLELGGR